MAQSQNQKPQVVDSSHLNEIVSTVSDVSEKAMEESRKAVDKSVQVAKDYPVHTAIGAGVVGFVAGVITNKLLK
ncbi:MAG: hypothetical protein VXV96_14920 [Bdellovibrionota bacterium]|mgnify:FL=1|jgi:ElaB/YqjD/DUF883 family membrane-anchored ribosome-binding protein|nr:hypothetical protein [Bdellovibrionota bacterium]